jgi:hypothetical protein
MKRSEMACIHIDDGVSISRSKGKKAGYRQVQITIG